MEAAGGGGSGGGGSGGGGGDAIVKSLLSLAQSLAPEDRAALIKQLMAAAISGAGGAGGDGASGSKAIVDGLLNIAHALTPEDRAALIKQLMAVGGNDTALPPSSGVDGRMLERMQGGGGQPGGGGSDDGLCWKCNQKKRRSSFNQAGKLLSKFGRMKSAAAKVISVGDQGVTSIINSSGSNKMWKKAAAMRLESFCQQIARVYESKIRSHDRDDVRGIKRQVLPEFLRDFLIQQVSCGSSSCSEGCGMMVLHVAKKAVNTSNQTPVLRITHGRAHSPHVYAPAHIHAAHTIAHCPCHYDGANSNHGLYPLHTFAHCALLSLTLSVSVFRFAGHCDADDLVVYIAELAAPCPSCIERGPVVFSIWRIVHRSAEPYALPITAFSSR